MKGFKSFKPRHLAIMLVAAMGQLTPVVGETQSVEENIKATIDDIAENLKGYLDKLQDNVQTVQKYFDNYQWKGVISDRVAFGPVSLSKLYLNGHNRAVIVKRGEYIDVSVDCDVDKHGLSNIALYRVVLGFKDVGPEASICSCLGATGCKKHEEFKLRAPEEPGLYQIRFRFVESYTEGQAFREWYDHDGKQPDATTTIGLVYVTKQS